MRFPRTVLAEYARRTVEEGLISGPEGNLSVKVKDRVYITPGNVFKRNLGPQDIAVLDLEGNLIEGRHPSSEYRLHLKIYAQRPDVSAIIHAHPPYTLALSLAGEDFKQAYLAETPLYLGEIDSVPYFLPGSEELAQAVAEAAKEPRKVLVLQRHGAVAWGKDLAEALSRLIVLEKTFKVVWLAKALDQEIKPLTPDELKELFEKRL